MIINDAYSYIFNFNFFFKGSNGKLLEHSSVYAPYSFMSNPELLQTSKKILQNRQNVIKLINYIYSFYSKK